MPISNLSNGLRTGVCTSTNRPTTPYEGQVIYETDTDLSYIWGGTAWQQVSGGTAVGNSGLVYVTSATVGTGVSTVTVSNAFNSTYDNYVVLYSGGTASTSTNISLALGSSTTTYYQVLIYGSYAGSGPSIATTNNNRVAWAWCGGADTTFANMNMTLMQPYLALYTRVSANTYEGTNNTGSMTGIHKSSTSYSAFTLSLDAGTLTGGTVTVYGYRKA